MQGDFFKTFCLIQGNDARLAGIGILFEFCRLSVKRSGDTSAARPLIVVSVFLNKTKRDYVTHLSTNRS